MVFLIEHWVPLLKTFKMIPILPEINNTLVLLFAFIAGGFYQEPCSGWWWCRIRYMVYLTYHCFPFFKTFKMIPILTEINNTLVLFFAFIAGGFYQEPCSGWWWCRIRYMVYLTYHCFPFFKTFKMIPILTYVCLRIHNSEQEDRFKEDSLMMVMEVPDHPQNEISQRSTHLIQHIKKSAHLDENPKTESKNVIARSYIATPFSF